MSRLKLFWRNFDKAMRAQDADSLFAVFDAAAVDEWRFLFIGGQFTGFARRWPSTITEEIVQKMAERVKRLRLQYFAAMSIQQKSVIAHILDLKRIMSQGQWSNALGVMQVRNCTLFGPEVNLHAFSNNIETARCFIEYLHAVGFKFLSIVTYSFYNRTKAPDSAFLAALYHLALRFSPIFRISIRLRPRVRPTYSPLMNYIVACVDGNQREYKDKIVQQRVAYDKIRERVQFRNALQKVAFEVQQKYLEILQQERLVLHEKHIAVQHAHAELTFFMSVSFNVRDYSATRGEDSHTENVYRSHLREFKAVIWDFARVLVVGTSSYLELVEILYAILPIMRDFFVGTAIMDRVCVLVHRCYHQPRTRLTDKQ